MLFSHIDIACLQFCSFSMMSLNPHYSFTKIIVGGRFCSVTIQQLLRNLRPVEVTSIKKKWYFLFRWSLDVPPDRASLFLCCMLIRKITFAKERRWWVYCYPRIPCHQHLVPWNRPGACWRRGGELHTMNSFKSVHHAKYFPSPPPRSQTHTLAVNAFTSAAFLTASLLKIGRLVQRLRHCSFFSLHESPLKFPFRLSKLN